MKLNNKEILEQANACVSNGDYEGFLAFCAEDTEWHFIGEQTLSGKEAVRQYMKTAYLEPPKFNIELAIAENDYVTVIGKISLKQENGSIINYDYCDVWKFKNGKMAVLKAFVIEG